MTQRKIIIIVTSLMLSLTLILGILTSQPIMAEQDSDPDDPILPLVPHRESIYDPASDSEVQAIIAQFEAVRDQGPEAILAFGANLHGPALDSLQDEINAAREVLWQPTVAVDRTQDQTLADEAAHNAASSATQSPIPTSDPQENRGTLSPATAAPQNADGTAATVTVGSGCNYATISDAIANANSGDEILIEGGMTFKENLDIQKHLTLTGGYPGCDSGSTAATIIDGRGLDSVIIISNGPDVVLEKLEITNGEATGLPGKGGGIRIGEIGSGGSLQLTRVNIYGNTANWGGGLWAGIDVQITGSSVNIHTNTATVYGGGMRLYGASAEFSNADIYDNAAPSGGGVYATAEEYDSVLYMPELLLNVSADIRDNDALTGDGLGGGLYLRQGSIYAYECSDLYQNDAFLGGGAYVITSTFLMDGSCGEVQNNTADSGGGIYAIASEISLDDDAEIYSNDATSGEGGGVYLDNSTLWGDSISIRYNEAYNDGGGVYAVNSSVIDLDLGIYGNYGSHQSQLANNTAGGYGGGAYVIGDSDIDLRQIFVEDNTGYYGGGIYAWDSYVTVYGDLFAENNATIGIGDGIRLYDNATMIARHLTMADNDASGASTGEAVALNSATMTMENSIVWGHATSIDDVSGTNTIDVTCSDIQGGYTGVDNRNEDPLFANTSADDYHITVSSPVVDRCSIAPGNATDFDNGHRPVTLVRQSTPYDMGADETGFFVGLNNSGCVYGAIQDAVLEAVPGDTIKLMGRTFYQTVDVDKDVTIVGGNASDCLSASTHNTIVDGTDRGNSIFDVNGATVTLQDMSITNGSTASNGGGLDAVSGAQVMLDNVDITGNQAAYGGGVYIDTTSVVTASNHSSITYNTATTLGGGVRVYGGEFYALDTYSDISNNSAPHGGGIHAVENATVVLEDADVGRNSATDAVGTGGGIYLDNGASLHLSGTAYVYNDNSAYDGAGLYADDAEVTMLSGTVFRNNHASHHGGAMYLTNNTEFTGTNISVGYRSSVFENTALHGGGMYVLTSTVTLEGEIINNHAQTRGGGIYAAASTITLNNTLIGGTGANDPNLVTDVGFGAGLYFKDGTHVSLMNTDVISNGFGGGVGSAGGGIYLEQQSVLTMTESSLVLNHAKSWGGGLYVRDATATLNNTSVLTNSAYQTGGGIRVYGDSTLNVLSGSEFIANTANTENGGALAVGLGIADVSLDDVTFTGNEAGVDGGAISIEDGTLYARNCIFQQNSAVGDGGAIYGDSTLMTLTVDGDTCNLADTHCSVLDNNIADSDGNGSGNGGGLYCYSCELLMKQMYVHHNGAYLGGGVFVDGSNTSTFRNVLIYQNVSEGGGGAGIRNEGTAVKLNHVTVVSNQKAAGYSQSGGSVVFNRSIAWDNQFGGVTMTGGTSSWICSIDQSANAGTATNPNFVQPGVYDYHLEQSSPGVDACASGLSVDLEGTSRPQGSRYDMGVYERAGQFNTFLPLALRSH